MVALKKYDRIEAAGLWRANADEQRREVVVVLGDATLTIRTTSDQALAHWSIAALARSNPGKLPARFHPDGDPNEELELAADEIEMIDALDKLRRAVDRARPRPGRLRWLGVSLSIAVIVYAAVFWLPSALLDHTLRVVPSVARIDIGRALLGQIQGVTGPACATAANNSVLARLGARLDAPRLAIMRGDVKGALHLPGGQIVLSRALVEDYEEPDVAAGFILAEQTAAAQIDPLRDLLEHAGVFASFRLLTTGELDPSTLSDYAADVLTKDRAAAPQEALLARFEQAGLRSTPYAYALDVTGETVLWLIEADPMKSAPLSPLLSDADWLRLQAVGMILSYGRQYLFIHIPKTGGTSMALALEARAMKNDIMLGDTPKAKRRRGRLKDVKARGRLWKHSKISDLDGLVRTEDVKGLFCFTLVRNPWSRLVSSYFWLREQSFDHAAVRRAKALGFEDFSLHPQTLSSLRSDPARRYMTDAAGVERCDTYIRLEHLTEDLEPLEAHLGFTLDIPNANASAAPADWASLYTRHMTEAVGLACEEDISRFGYRFP